MNEKEHRLFAVLGTVLNVDSFHGIGGLRVEAWDKDLICDDFLGSAVTNEDGTFHLRFDKKYFQELFVDRRPDVTFKVFYGEELIKSTEGDVLWNVRSGDRNVVIEVNLPAWGVSGEAAVGRIDISGLLLKKNSGYPLAGMRVRVFLVGTLDEGATIEPDHDSPSAEGISGTSGRFSLLLDGLESSVKGFVLVCEDASGSVIFTSIPYSLSKPPENLILHLPIVEPSIDLASWQVLAKRMAQTRIVQLHELVRQLCTVGPGNTDISDLSMDIRLGMVSELEHAFLDPDGILRSYIAAPTFKGLNSPASLNQYVVQFKPYLGEPGVKNALDELISKLDTFSSLLEVDWVMDVDALKEGDTNLAVNKFSSMYTATFADDLSMGFEPNPDFQLLVPTEWSRYRDYLRTIFTGLEGTEIYPNNLDILKKRFHQDFETLDTQTRPANAIVIGILKKILMSLPNENYGFGLLPGLIDTQGQRSDREYLDYLIDLTKLSAKELGLRYRLDLERPDSAMSSEVQENITTRSAFTATVIRAGKIPFLSFPSGCWERPPFSSITKSGFSRKNHSIRKIIMDSRVSGIRISGCKITFSLGTEI